MATEDFRAGAEWDDTPSSELDPLVCRDIRFERDGVTSFGTRPPLDDSWGRLRPATDMPDWAQCELPTESEAR